MDDGSLRSTALQRFFKFTKLVHMGCTHADQHRVTACTHASVPVRIQPCQYDTCPLSVTTAVAHNIKPAYNLGSKQDTVHIAGTCAWIQVSTYERKSILYSTYSIRGGKCSHVCFRLLSGPYEPTTRTIIHLSVLGQIVAHWNHLQKLLMKNINYSSQPFTDSCKTPPDDCCIWAVWKQRASEKYFQTTSQFWNKTWKFFNNTSGLKQTVSCWSFFLNLVHQLAVFNSIGMHVIEKCSDDMYTTPCRILLRQFILPNICNSTALWKIFLHHLAHQYIRPNAVSGTNTELSLYSITDNRRRSGVCVLSSRWTEFLMPILSGCTR